jgi:hypothetical protein
MQGDVCMIPTFIMVFSLPDKLHSWRVIKNKVSANYRMRNG